MQGNATRIRWRRRGARRACTPYEPRPFRDRPLWYTVGPSDTWRTGTRTRSARSGQDGAERTAPVDFAIPTASAWRAGRRPRLRLGRHTMKHLRAFAGRFVRPAARPRGGTAAWPWPLPL